MKKKPVIGVISASHWIGGVRSVYATYSDYPEQVKALGGIPIQVPMIAGTPEEDQLEIISRCDGFLLVGGADFSCSWYGEELLPNLEPDDTCLDLETQETALRFVRLAASSGKPVFGICLGMQVLNVAFGGSLWQDIPTQKPSELTHSNPYETIADRSCLAHSVTTEPDSLIRRLSGETIRVNSFHHQAVKAPAHGFRITAYATDGIPEALESPTAPILAVQWHPENLSNAGFPEAQNLFRWLVETAAELASKSGSFRNRGR